MYEEILATVPLFSSLTGDQLAAVAVRLKRRQFEERDVIIRQDDPGDAMFVLVSGRVKVSVQEGEGETILAVLGAGDCFGELALVDGERRSADVVAVEPTEVLILSTQDFQDSVREMPGIAFGLLREMAGRLRRSNQWVRSLSSQDVYGRIAAQLLHLADTHGVDVPGGRRILLRLTQNDLAAIIGSSRESVNKAVGYFKTKRVISVDTSYHITIHDTDSLRKRSR
jgi:CRP/FNR family cyclic AMP-dependent transcriptional regulator